MVHGASAQFDFSLYDGCVECVYKKEAEEYFRWNIDDDWSHAPMLADEKQVYTVVVLSKDEKVLYGSPAPFLRSKRPLSTPKFAITLQRFFIPRWLCCAFWGKLLISDKN